MNNNRYIILDGEFFPEDKPVLTVSNRSFRFGDAVFETLRYHKGIPMFFEEHYSRLQKGIGTLGMNNSKLPPTDDCKKLLDALVVKNNIFKDARIRFTVFRKNGGLFTPQQNDISYLIEATPLNDELYTLNKKGKLIGIFTQIKKTASPLSSFKNANSLINVLAGIFKKEQELDDCLIINENNKIIEGISSNLFWIKGKTVYTAAVSSGCIDGIMRAQVIKAVKQTKLHFSESDGTTEEELTDADEIFLTNAITSIQWVVGLDEKRYYNFNTKEIYRNLLRDITGMIEEKLS